MPGAPNRPWPGRIRIVGFHRDMPPIQIAMRHSLARIDSACAQSWSLLLGRFQEQGLRLAALTRTEPSAALDLIATIQGASDFGQLAHGMRLLAHLHMLLARWRHERDDLSAEHKWVRGALAAMNDHVEGAKAPTMDFLVKVLSKMAWDRSEEPREEPEEDDALTGLTLFHEFREHLIFNSLILDGQPISERILQGALSAQADALAWKARLGVGPPDGPIMLWNCRGLIPKSLAHTTQLVMSLAQDDVPSQPDDQAAASEDETLSDDVDAVADLDDARQTAPILFKDEEVVIGELDALYGRSGRWVTVAQLREIFEDIHPGYLDQRGDDGPVLSLCLAQLPAEAIMSVELTEERLFEPLPVVYVPRPTDVVAATLVTGAEPREVELVARDEALKIGHPQAAGWFMARW